MVVPVDESAQLVLVRQFRYLWKRESLEFPGGGIGREEPLTSAKNELAEEANLAASKWELVGEYNPFNGATDEVARVYLATDLSVSEKEKDPSEEFEVVRMSVSDLEKAIDERQIWDGMTLSAWMLARPAVLTYLSTLKK